MSEYRSSQTAEVAVDWSSRMSSRPTQAYSSVSHTAKLVESNVQLLCVSEVGFLAPFGNQTMFIR